MYVVIEDCPTVWYQDNDSDGWGNSEITDTGCLAPEGYVALGFDYNNLNSAVFPGNDEICNSIDDDCDTFVDESDAIDAFVWYLDSDEDGYGGSPSVKSCTKPTGYVDDCDDSNNQISPKNKEDCLTPSDDNCNGLTNEKSAQNCSYFYLDSDVDGYGSSSSECWCEPSGLYTETSFSDCDDSDGNPRATETCNSLARIMHEQIWLKFFQYIFTYF